MTRAQVRLLDLFQKHEVPEEVWERIRRELADYFAGRAVAEADRVADREGWTEADFDRLLGAHERTPYE